LLPIINRFKQGHRGRSAAASTITADSSVELFGQPIFFGPEHIDKYSTGLHTMWRGREKCVSLFVGSKRVGDFPDVTPVSSLLPLTSPFLHHFWVTTTSSDSSAASPFAESWLWQLDGEAEVTTTKRNLALKQGEMLLVRTDEQPARVTEQPREQLTDSSYCPSSTLIIQNLALVR